MGAGQGFSTHVPARVVGALAQKELRARMREILTGSAKARAVDWTNMTRKDRRNICILMTILQELVDKFARKTDFQMPHPARPINRTRQTRKLPLSKDDLRSLYIAYC